MASSGPLALSSLTLALAWNTRSTVISALRPSSVNCWSPRKKVFNSCFLDFFCFFHVGVHRFTMPLTFFLPFCSVFDEVPFNAVPFAFFSPGSKQAASYQVFSCGFLGLSPEYSPLVFLPYILRPLLHVVSQTLGFSSFLGRILNILLCNREIFFRVSLVFHDFLF